MFPRSLQCTFCVFWQIFLLLGFIKQPGSLLSLLTTRQINPQGRLASPRDSSFPGSDLEAQRTSGWGSGDHRKGCPSELPRHHGFCVEPWDERLKKGKINVFVFFFFFFFLNDSAILYWEQSLKCNYGRKKKSTLGPKDPPHPSHLSNLEYAQPFLQPPHF